MCLIPEVIAKKAVSGELNADLECMITTLCSDLSLNKLKNGNPVLLGPQVMYFDFSSRVQIKFSHYLGAPSHSLLAL